MKEMSAVPSSTEGESMDRARLLESLKKRYGYAKGIADQWESILEACFHYAVPFRNKFYEPGPMFQGEIKNAQIIDTTAVEATKTFVSKLQDTMTPTQSQWAYLAVNEYAAKVLGYEKEDMEEAQRILTDYMRQVFVYINKSNFDVIANECYYDLSIGTASMVINSNTDKDPLMFTSIPIDKLAIEEAANGKIESWFRTWDNLKISELATRWRNIQITSMMESDMRSDPDAKVKKIYEGTAFFPLYERPYCYCVWTDEGILLSEWMTTNPGVVWRWQKTNNETWGRGPVMDALPSMISLNEIARIEMAAANLNTFKPYMAFGDSVFNPYTFNLQPFTVIPIAPIGTGGQVPLIPLESSADPQFSQMMIADLRMQIKALLFAEQPTDSMGVQPQTAFELSLKQQTLAQKIGPLFSRAQQEYHEPVINRVQDILHDRGILLRPELGGMPISFIYKSPLALSKGQEDIARFTQFMQVMQGVMGPEAAQVYVNPMETPYLMADMLQVDPRFLNGPDAVAQVMQMQQDKMSMQEMVNTEGSETEQAVDPIEQQIQG